VAVEVSDSGVETQEFLGSLDLPETELTTLLLPWWNGGIVLDRTAPLATLARCSIRLLHRVALMTY